MSVYEVNNSSRNIPVPLINILRGIINGELKDKVNAIRRYMEEGDMKAANTLKASLPSFTVGGVFCGGHAVRNLVQASNLIVLDFDKVLERLEELRALCNADPHTLSSFRSPKDGFKVIVYVENMEGRHKEAYEMVRMHYEQITGIELDTSGKDLSRTCLMSYDPQGYVAALYDSFVLPPQKPQEDTPADTDAPGKLSDAPDKPSDAPDKPSEDAPADVSRFSVPPVPAPGVESFLGREKAFLDANLLLCPLREGNRHNGSFALGCKAAKAGCDLETVYSDLAKRICNEDFTASHLRQNLSLAYQQVMRDGVAKVGKTRSANDSPVLPFCHYGASSSEEGKEEAYLCGEELRKNTPCFSDKVYKNIPDMLSECLESDMTLRQRDSRLLGCLVSFSAMLPSTWGQYCHKRYSPHLFGLIVAPPASGKGAAEAGVHLLDVTNDMLEAQSDAAQEKYEREKEQYDIRLQHNKHSKEPVELPEKPKEPVYRSLLIPANTSNSRMIMQLKDNGSMGGLLFDTEADTLTANNKQDYGHVDTILCKAFEHEAVSTSFFAHGKKPVRCSRPSMAMMLTCTTTQVEGLLNSVEGGLPSRILINTFRVEHTFHEANGDGESTEDLFECLSQKAYRLFCFCNEHPMTFRFSRAQWDELNLVFNSLAQDAYLEDRDDLQATVHRYEVCVMRVAMVMTRLNQFEEEQVDEIIYCPERFFRAALDMVLCCYEHCRLLFTSLGISMYRPLRNPNERHFPLEELPQQFTRAEAVALGVSRNFSERMVDRLLVKMEGLLIRRIAQGRYEKLVARVA